MRRPLPAPLAWLGGLLGVYLIAPFVAGTTQLGLADWRSVDWPSLASACVVSLTSATLATLLVALGGIPLGYFLARVPGRGMTLLGFVVQLPLALPPLASGILLLFLLGYASPIGRLTGGALTDSFTGIVLAEAFVAAPFLIIAARSAFAGLDLVLEDVAATLGHRPWSIFVRVSLPLVWRAIMAGMLLAWLRAFGEFGATVMVAYHPYSLPVYTYVAFGSQGLPAMLPVVLPMLLAAIVVMVAATVVGGHRRARPGRLPPVERSEAGAALVGMRQAAATPRPLDFAFHRQLDGFDLDVAWRTNTRRLAVLGASGSGKSLTLRLIAGLDHAPNEVLTLAGRDLSAIPPEQRGIAYVPQTLGLFPHFTLARQLRFAVGWNAEVGRQWIDRLGLCGLEQRLPAALSLGQQQRVALARAFSRSATLLLLDEPFSALDTPLRAQLGRELRALQEAVDVTTVLVTHDPKEAFLLADELLILDAGRVLQSGLVEQVFARPASDLVARLLGVETIGAGRVVAADRIDIGGGIELDIAGPDLPLGAQVGWSVRPRDIAIVADGRYPGLVERVGKPMAGQREVTVRLGGCLLRTLSGAGGAVVPGPCRVSIHPASMQVWIASE